MENAFLYVYSQISDEHIPNPRVSRPIVKIKLKITSDFCLLKIIIRVTVWFKNAIFYVFYPYYIAYTEIYYNNGIRIRY